MHFFNQILKRGVFLDLASSGLGTSIVEVTDEFFAPAITMINPEPAISCPDKFVGKKKKDRNLLSGL